MKPQRIRHALFCDSNKSVGIQFFNEDGKVLYEYKGFGVPIPAGLVGGTHKKKDWNKQYAEENGVTARNLCEIVKAVVMREVIKPYPLWDKMYWHKSPWGKTQREVAALEHYDILEQCQKDATMHLAPFVLYHGMTPAELKKHYGKGLWKLIAGNSLSRNKKLVNFAFLPISDFEVKARMKTSCFGLVRHRECDQETIDKVRLHLGLKSYKAMWKNQEVTRCFQIIDDTKRSLGEAYNPKWSYRRIKEEHDGIAARRAQEHRESMAKSDAEYAKLMAVDIPSLHAWMEEFEMCGIKATPLKNMQEILQEGDKMYHCVGSYARDAAKGEYVVWHLQKGEEHATLGITVHNSAVKLGTSKETYRSRKYMFQQMYGVCNNILKDDSFKTVADWIVDKMQEAYLKEVENE